VDEDGKADWVVSLRMRRKETKQYGKGDEGKFIDRQVTAELVAIPSSGTVKAVQHRQPTIAGSTGTNRLSLEDWLYQSVGRRRNILVSLLSVTTVRVCRA
jgi:hypothetical protein